MSHVDHPERGIPGKQLSGRQLQVILRIAQGMTNTQIAKDLVVTENTVATTICRALKQTGARDRAHLVAVTLSAHRIPPVRAPHPGAVEL